MSVTFPEPAEERDAQPQPEPEPECSEQDGDECLDGGLFGLDEVPRPANHIDLY